MAMDPLGVDGYKWNRKDVKPAEGSPRQTFWWRPVEEPNKSVMVGHPCPFFVSDTMFLF
jgi:hypothetical protein